MLGKTTIRVTLTTMSGGNNEAIVSPMRWFLSGDGKSIVVTIEHGDEEGAEEISSTCVSGIKEGFEVVSRTMPDGYPIDMSQFPGIVSGLRLDPLAVDKVCTLGWTPFRWKK